MRLCKRSTTIMLLGFYLSIAGSNRFVDARQFYDPAPLEQLAKEGFIRELYPR